MKIIKEGKEHFNTFKMACTECGCQFEVGMDECFIDRPNVCLTYPPKQYVYANCPHCHKMCKNAHDVKTVEEVLKF